MLALKEVETNDKTNFPSNLTGYAYQLKLLLLFLWRGREKFFFKLGTEIKDAEKFDDVVFFNQTKEGQQLYAMCLQAKHTRNKGAELKFEHFISKDDNNTAICNLRKYFISFRKILQRKLFFPNESIICTNFIIPNSKTLQNPDNTDEIISFESVTELQQSHDITDEFFVDSSKKWERHKLNKLGENIEKMLQNQSNLHLLAKELVISIVASEKKEISNVKLDLKNYWFSLYHLALFNENVILTKDVIMFKKEFINGKNPKLVNDIRIQYFRDFFIKEYYTKADWSYIRNVRFNNVFINFLHQKNKKETKKSEHNEMEIIAASFLRQLKSGEVTEDSLKFYPVLKKVYRKLQGSEGISKKDVDVKTFIEMYEKECQGNLTDKTFKWFTVDTSFTEMLKNPKIKTSQQDSDIFIMKKLCEHLIYEIPLTNKPLFIPYHHFLNNIFVQSSLLEDGKMTKFLISILPLTELKKFQDEKLAIALIWHALNPDISELDPILTENSDILQNIIYSEKQNTFSDDFFDINHPRNMMQSMILENYMSSEIFKKDKVLSFEIESKDGNAKHMKEENVEDLEKEMARCFFLKKKISNTIKKEYTKKFNYRFYNDDTKFVINIEQNNNPDFKRFFDNVLTLYAIERLKHLQFTFLNSQAEEVIKEVLKAVFNPTAKLDLKKYEMCGKNGVFEMLTDELFDLDVVKKTIMLKESVFDDNFQLSGNAETFRTEFKKQMEKMSIDCFADCRIKIKTWADLFVESKSWVTEKIKKVAEEIKNLLENGKEGQIYFKYDKEKCIENGTPGLLEYLLMNVLPFSIRKNEKYVEMSPTFLDQNNVSDAVKILHEELSALDKNKFKGIIVLKSLFNNGKHNDSDLQTKNLAIEIVDLLNTKSDYNDDDLIYNRLNYEKNETAGFIESLIGSVFEEKDNILVFNKDLAGNLFMKKLKEVYSLEILKKLRNREILLNQIPSHRVPHALDNLVTDLVTRLSPFKYSGTNNNLFQALSETVFVCTNVSNEIKFTSYFLECEKWSKEAEELKRKLEENLDDNDFKNLKEYDFEITINQQENKKRNSIAIALEIANTIETEICKNREKNPIELNISFSDKDEKNIISLLLESVFVFVDEISNMRKFKDIFFKCGKWSSTAEIFREKLKEQLYNKNLNDLKHLIIEDENYRFCCDNLIQSGDINNEIAEFKNKLLIVTTPDEETLFKIISKEINENLDLLNDEGAAKLFFNKVLDWAKEKESRFLSNDDVKKLIMEIKGKMSSIIAGGFLYRAKLRSYKMAFNNTKIEDILKNYLKGSGKFLLLKSNFFQFTAIKVDKYLHKEPHYQAINNVMFHKFSNLPALEEYEIKKGKILGAVSSAFSSEGISNLMVVVDDSIFQSVTPQSFRLLKNLLNIALLGTNKKFILITETGSQFFKFLKTENFLTEYNFEEYIDHIRFEDLTKPSQARLITQDVSFQRLKIGNALNFSKDYDPESYIERLVGIINLDTAFFKTCENLNKNVKNLANQRHIFVFHGIDLSFFKKFFKSNGINPDNRDIPYKCSRTYDSERVREMYIPHKILIISENPKKKVEAYVDEDFFIHHVSQNRIVYINDIAGMGKSTMLSSLERKIKNHKMLKWVIRFNMIDCTEKLRTLGTTVPDVNQKFYFNFDGKINKYEDILFDALTKSGKFDNTNTTFENDTFKFMFNNGMILVIIDGYDEIGAKYRQIVKSWITRLQNKSSNQIWISSRTDFKLEIEELFKIPSYSLNRLSKYEQRKMLCYIWIKKWEEMLNVDRKIKIYLYAYELLSAFNRVMENNTEYTGNLLHVILLADVFWKNTEVGEKMWMGCYDFVTCLEKFGHAEANISVKLKNLFVLYDSFVRKKIKEYYFRGKNIYNSLEDSVAAKEEKNYLESHQMHCILGIVSMTEEDKYMALLDANEKIMFEEWQNNIIRENIGIVSAAPNDKAPIFLYYSYAEYFAACYLCNKLTSSSAVNEMVLNTIFDIVQNDVVVFSYCVKHLLHENIKSDTSLQIIIYDFIFNNKMNGYAFIKWLMNEEKVDDKLPKQDAAGRTYLHYAVLSQKVKNVVYVLLHTFHLISNNNVNESLFILSEYINVPDKTGQTALMYGKNQVKALLKDIKNAGQQECAPPEYDRNVVVFLNNLSRRNRTSDLCIIFKNQGKYSENVFQKLFSNISFSSLLCILHNSDPILLYILLNDDEKGLNVFDHLCFEENFVHEERLEIFKFWWKNEDIKDHATDKMIMAAIENDCLDYFKFFLKKTGCTLDVRKCFFVACSANVLTFVDFILNSDFDEIMKYFSHSLPDLKYVANMKIAERIILKTKPDLYALIRERPFKKSVMERMGSDFVLKIIEYFLDIDADLTFFNKFSEGIWKYVLEKGDDTLIKRLLHKNALKISQLQEIHESSFPYKQRVIQNLQSCIENVKSYYSEEKYNINTDDNGESRLLKALYDENEILFAFLLRKGADVNCVNENGKTLLNLACDRYKDDFVNLALGYGASFDIHDAEGKIDFWDPSKSNLNQLAFTFQHLNENDFWKKLRDNEYFRSDDFVNNERDFFNFSVTNTAKETLWHLGADGDTLPKLINIKREETRVQNEYKDTINNQNSNGHTPLHLAAKRNKKNNVKLLLEEGAYYNVTNNSKTPEDLSEKGGETQIFLHKIDLLFHHAEYSNAEKWIDFKIQKFKNLVNDDNDNYSESISDDDLSWIFKNLQILKNHQAETLLHKASQNPDHTVINFVLDLMFDEDLEEQKNVLSRIEYQNLLLSLIESNRLQAAKILVEEGILFNNAEFKISKINKKCECAIEFDKIREVFDHIYKEDFNFVQRKIELNELKIDIKNVRDYKGKTISDYAKHTTNYSFMVFLLNQGVKVTDLKAVTNKKMKQTILLHLFPKKQKISTTTPQRRQFVIISFAAIILFVFIIISKK